jgi:hypothetical protein
MSKKVYLGDSVYVDNDGYHLVLTTDNGLGPNNTIYLEPHFLELLIDYRNSLTRKSGVAAEE